MRAPSPDRSRRDPAPATEQETNELTGSWEDYHRLIEHLALQLHNAQAPFDQIVALSRGGLRLGDALSRLFQRPLVVIAAIGSTIPILIVLTGLIYASSVFRIARSLGLEVMVSDFVEAAKVRGEGLWWIITQEVLPNVAMPMATDFGLRFVYVILFISSLSFLGLGVQPPQSDWGSMVRENLAGLPYGSIAPLVPAMAIAMVTISVNLIVDDVSAHAGGRLAKKML